MENRSESWAPQRILCVIGCIAAVVFAGVGVLLLAGGDRAGPVLLGVATLAALALACYTGLARPRLAADNTGIRLRTLAGTHDFSWHEISASVASTRRLGRDVATLELDSGERPPHLFVLGRLELNAEPADVLDTLNELRAAQAPE